MAYDRPWKSFAEQLELLKLRGMMVTDETAALSYLERIGYAVERYKSEIKIPA